VIYSIQMWHHFPVRKLIKPRELACGAQVIKSSMRAVSLVLSFIFSLLTPKLLMLEADKVTGQNVIDSSKSEAQR
jgi:hypothetical protein